jgi:hypothetical protein
MGLDWVGYKAGHVTRRTVGTLSGDTVLWNYPCLKDCLLAGTLVGS